MSVESLAIVLHHSRAKGSAKLVLVGIANHDGDGGAWPAMATLARYANVSRDNARKAVQSLVKLREVEVEVQAGGLPTMAEHERPNRYRITLQCPPWCDRTMQHRDTRKPRRATLPIDPPSETMPPIGNEGTPPSETMNEPSTNHLPTNNPVSHVSNRARVRKPAPCSSTGDPHRLNKSWGVCADCGQAPEAWAWDEVPA